MKYTRILGLAAVAAMAIMAFVGAGTASATEICSTNTTPCSGVMYEPGTQISTKLAGTSEAVLTSSITNVNCKKSTTTGETTTTGGGEGVPVEGIIKTLTFTECKTSGGTACTVSSVNLNYAASIEATGGGNGTLAVVEGTGGGEPGAHVQCGFLINCTFTTPEAVLSVTGGNPANAKANEISLERNGGFCPAEAFWTAEYEVTAPKPLFAV